MAAVASLEAMSLFSQDERRVQRAASAPGCDHRARSGLTALHISPDGRSEQPLRSARQSPAACRALSPAEAARCWREPSPPPGRLDWDFIAQLPHVLSGWIQLLGNVAIAGCCVYMLLTFKATIEQDVSSKVAVAADLILEEIAQCQRDYAENRCKPSTRVPAMAAQCRVWEDCMTRDPQQVAWSKYSAQTLGEALNEFFGALSWKAIVCLLGLLGAIVLQHNLAFSRKPRQDASDYVRDYTPRARRGGSRLEDVGYSPRHLEYDDDSPRYSPGQPRQRPRRGER